VSAARLRSRTAHKINNPTHTGALGNAAAATLAAATAAATAVATLATATSTHHCQQSSGSALKL